ncbi:MAG: glycosyltransferase family 39 protein [Planctomycetes bacterium]|nr:glycosyltransferase family 39 protein [Planctomycetota bacterium]
MKTSHPPDGPIGRFLGARPALVRIGVPAAVFAVAVAVVAIRGVHPADDGKTFEQLALNLIRHKTYTWGDGEEWDKKTHIPKERAPLEPCADYAPLHPLVLAMAITVGRSGYGIVGMANALWLAGAALFAVLLAAKASDDARVPVITGLLTLATVPLYSGLTNFYREPLYIFLLMGAAYFLARAFSDRTRLHPAILAGVFWGLSILCKPILLIFAPFYVIFRVACRPDDETTRRGLHRALIVVLVCAAVVAPWVIRNAVQGIGPTVATQGGLNFMSTVGDTGNISTRLYPDNNDTHWLLTGRERAELSETAINRLIYIRKLRRLKADPALAAKILALNFLRLIYFIDSTTGRVHLTWVIAAPFFALGLWHTLARRGGRWRVRALPATMIAAFCAGLVIHIASPGYRLPIEPLVFVIAAHGMVQLDDRLAVLTGTAWRRLFWPCYLGCCVAFYFAYTPAARRAISGTVSGWLG